MSQTTQSIPLRGQLAAHRAVGISALLALLCTAAVVLVLALDGGSSPTTPATAARPDESATAAAISRASGPVEVGRPDESGIAAAIGSSDGPQP